MAAIVVAHGVLLAIAWQPGTAPKAATPQRVSMRWLASVPRAQVAAPIVAAVAENPLAKPVAKGHATKPRATPPPQPRVATVEVVPAVVTAVPIQGVAFAPPAIGFGPPPVRRSTSFAAALPPPPTTQFIQMQEQMQHQAARAQIDDALQRELGAWQPPLASQGACALAAEPESHLACDNDTIGSAIAPREPALAGLLRAWRSMEPRTQGLTIAVVDGRYQASWN